MSKMSRRRFLHSAAAGVGAGVMFSGLSWPHIWVRRNAFAAPAFAAGPTGGAIFFVLNGGARTQCLFNGMVNGGANPFGNLAGVPVPLSAVMAGTGLDDPAVNGKLNLLVTCQHHNRTGNHGTGRVVACTGWTPDENKPGILTALNYTFSFRDVPCVHIGNDTPTTNIGTEISSTFSPIKINSPLNVQDIVDALQFVTVSEAEQSRLETLRFELQDRFLRGTRYRQPADIPFYQRKSVEIAQQFEDAALDIRSAASLGQYVDNSNVTNAGLRAIFGVAPDGGGNQMGARAMLAVRLRQLGCAGITISSDQNWDLHSNEDNSLPPRARNLGQAIAGLVNVLSRIPDPGLPGRTLLDTTVITVLTDFNRGNWSTGTGFNGNNGSDHITGEDKTAYQCIPIIGGGLPGGKVLGEITGAGGPAGSTPITETRQVLATVLDLLGVPPANFFPSSVRPLTQELMG